MNDNYLPAAITMGVSIFFRGATVGGPARVSDAVSAIQRLQADNFFQVAQFSFGAANLQAFTIATHGNAGGVVATILQPLEAIQNDWYDTLLANVPHNTAHAATPFFGGENRRYCLLISPGQTVEP